VFSRLRTPTPPAPAADLVEVTAADVLLIEELFRAEPICRNNNRGAFSSDPVRYSGDDLPYRLYERIGARAAAVDPDAITIALDRLDILHIRDRAEALEIFHPETLASFPRCKDRAHADLAARGRVLMRRLYIGLGYASTQPGPSAPIPSVAPALPTPGGHR
jgi:hypothetical protein